MKLLCRPAVVMLCASGLVSCGCTPSEKVLDSKSSEQALSVQIERSGDAGTSGTDDRPTAPRTLAFEMAGFGTQATTRPSAEQKAAATQAAVIDAFIKALVEARRSRGQTTSDFTAKLGPRLTVTHRAIGDGYEVEVSLIARGVDTTFIVRDGVQQHPPQDLKLLRQVFDETNGEFTLLTTLWRPARGGCEAKVACYLPAGMDTFFAGDPTGTTTP